MPKYQKFCTFFLNRLFFGLEVEKVQEVIRHQSITPVPLAPLAVRGLINLRGQIVPAIDLRRCLELTLDDGFRDAFFSNRNPKSASCSLGRTTPKLRSMSHQIGIKPLTGEISDEQLLLNVVLCTADEVISLLVDEVGEVLEIGDDCFENSPQNLKGKARNLIRGAYKLQDKLLLILDTAKIVEAAVAR